MSPASATFVASMSFTFYILQLLLHWTSFGEASVAQRFSTLANLSLDGE